VADQHDTHSAAAQFTRERKQGTGFGFRQGRCRLVHDEHAGLGGECLGDLDQLLFANPKGTDRRGRVGAKAERRQCPPRGVEHRSAIGKSEASPDFLAEEDVIDDGQCVDEIQFLVNDHDAGLRRVAHIRESCRDAPHADRSRVGRIQAAEHLHQAGLARAVFTDQRMDLACSDVEVHVQ
jgi:hypothetical protein